jgi:pyridoxine 5-phosphate synthase
LRNSRLNDETSVLDAARTCIEAGAHGITVHPRPDQRHARPSDVYELAEMLMGAPEIEFNVEGNPFPEFLEIVHKTRPTQCTLVPDSPNVLTSDRGWELHREGERLKPIINQLKDAGIRVSLFMDAESKEFEQARAAGADRVELYTKSYADFYGSKQEEIVYGQFAQAASAAQSAGLGVNAGHDLNLKNLTKFCSIPNILEVSIGHALISDALKMGLFNAVQAYLRAIPQSAP